MQGVAAGARAKKGTFARSEGRYGEPSILEVTDVLKIGTGAPHTTYTSLLKMVNVH